MSTPANTPNVVIESPKARKIARTILDVIGVTLGLVVVVDAASPAFTVDAFTVPALAGYAFLRAAFGISVDNPNTPKEV